MQKLKSAASAVAGGVKGAVNKLRGGEESQEIVKNLFVATKKAVEDDEFLKDNEVSHILTVGTKMEPKYPEKFTYLVVDVEDNKKQDILSYFGVCNLYIRESRKTGTGTLIHCTLGVSASVTVLCAYMMTLKNITAADALKMIQGLRGTAQPNEGFMLQLKVYEDMGSPFQGGKPTMLDGVLFVLQKHWRESEKEKKKRVLKMLLAPDPQEPIATTITRVERYKEGMKAVLPPGSGCVYVCSQCQRRLFYAFSIVPHDSLEHTQIPPLEMEAGAGADGAGCLGGPLDLSNICRYYFIEPHVWMATKKGHLDAQTGTIACPDCSAPLGTWDWQGASCTCKAAIRTAFRIDKPTVKPVVMAWG